MLGHNTDSLQKVNPVVVKQATLIANKDEVQTSPAPAFTAPDASTINTN